MRFTPDSSCTIKSAKVYSYNTAGSVTCYLYVWDDQGGLPGTEQRKTSYTPISQGWQTINLPTTISYDTDFWIGIEIPYEKTTYAISDSGLNYPTRMAWKRGTEAWAIASDASGDFKIRAIVSYVGIEEEILPVDPVLKQNFPNPVSMKTTISYAIPREARVKLEVYDITGGLVRTLVDEVQPAGFKEMIWDKKNEDGELVSSGVYFYTLNIGNRTLTKTMVVL